MTARGISCVVARMRALPLGLFVAVISCRQAREQVSCPPPPPLVECPPCPICATAATEPPRAPVHPVATHIPSWPTDHAQVRGARVAPQVPADVPQSAPQAPASAPRVAEQSDAGDHVRVYWIDDPPPPRPRPRTHIEIGRDGTRVIVPD